MRYRLFRSGILHGFVLLCILSVPLFTHAQDELSGRDKTIYGLALSCHKDIVRQLNVLLDAGVVTEASIFDTFYLPIPNTDPQKYHTQYDKFTDKVVQPILDECLVKNKAISFVVIVDRNGYLPTHNSKYSQPLTGNPEVDVKFNRAKRIFNDRTGLAAARNTNPYLVQAYDRDTGETMKDLSIPITLRGRHWGALRVGYFSQ